LKQIIFKPLQSRLWIQIAQELNSDSKFIVSQKVFHAEWGLGENDLKNYRELVTTANLLLRQWDFSLKEIKIVKSLEDLKESAIPAYHPSGTTRAHQSPEFGVVDSIGKVNGCDNLFICGSSVFTTPGWVNPTLTIMALSTRTARLSS
jgi:choline dehydrogenase-like flavoprotein